MLRVLLMKYQIETYTLCGSWGNTLLDENGAVVIFATYEAAQAELDDHLANLAHAVENGHMDDYNPEDYRIVGVPV
jgi:hypothetical protein